MDLQNKSEEEAQRKAAYKKQFAEKHRLHQQRLADARKIVDPPWWNSKYPQQGATLTTDRFCTDPAPSTGACEDNDM